MNVEQIYTGCLAQGAYYITSEGEAAIVDPLREVQPYIERANNDGVQIKYIFETHFHADFVSGHLDLSKKTGAQIVYGPTAKPEFDAIIAKDGQEFKIGNITIKTLHTPGHTLESTTYLLLDEEGKEHAIFSGDTLFLGDVGRPDLAQKADNLTKEDLAGMLYDSLTNKIMPLPNDVIVYPAHGAGSACGKNMLKETVDTLGHQKATNYALNQHDKPSFIKAVTDGLLTPPAYFPLNVALNKKGYGSFDEVLNRGMTALSADEFEAIAESSGALVIDTRNASEFAKAFIPQSVNIGINGDFAPWVGTLVVDVQLPLLLVSDPGKVEEAVTRLSRVGFDNIAGHLKDGFNTWLASGKEIDSIQQINADELYKQYNTNTMIVDVRKESEYSGSHVKDAESKPLACINEWMNKIDPFKHFYLHCAGGYRSMMAASILQARGYRNFTEVQGGYSAIRQTDIPTV